MNCNASVRRDAVRMRELRRDEVRELDKIR